MADRAAVLDIDGTLVDSNYEHVRAWSEAFRVHTFLVPQARIHHAIGMDGDMLAPHLLDLPEDDARIEVINQSHDRLFREQYLDTIRPLPDALTFVQQLKHDHYLVALATSAKRNELEHHVQLLGLAGLLDATVSKEDVAHSKPAPDLFATACQKLNVEPWQAVAVGDIVWDGESARRLGMPFVAVRTGGIGEQELREAGALAIYTDLPSLLAGWSESPFGTARNV